jgi:hypothetical protein
MEPNEHAIMYQIRVQSHLDERWLRWFEGLVILRSPNGETIISGVMDQSALHGILTRIRDLGLVLVSVQHNQSNDDIQVEEETP